MGHLWRACWSSYGQCVQQLQQAVCCGARYPPFDQHQENVYRAAPQNILINSGGQLKIADMGISHVVKSPTGTTKIRIGTPHYMAPEVWRKDPYSFPADIW